MRKDSIFWQSPVWQIFNVLCFLFTLSSPTFDTSPPQQQLLLHQQQHHHHQHLERDPDYKFTKNLPKKCDGFTNHEIEFACQVNSYKAPLKWYKDDEEISETDTDRYVVTKDIIGNATLVVKRAKKSDAGIYKCRIENTKLVTKCVLTVSGIPHLPTLHALTYGIPTSGIPISGISTSGIPISGIPTSGILKSPTSHALNYSIPTSGIPHLPTSHALTYGIPRSGIPHSPTSQARINIAFKQCYIT